MPSDMFFHGEIDANITEVWHSFPGIFRNHWLVITMLDSGPEPPKMTGWLENLKKADIVTQSFGNASLIEPTQIEALFTRSQTFVHYDECFLFRGAPKVPIQLNEHFTAERCSFSKGVPDILVQEMLHIGATGFLADGGGLNYVVDSLAVSTALKSTFG
ncbi:MAG: hypothetical protein K1X53_16380 [Candidatus Sumerlaeaceae bacterium]|nr:hypothetical protein [Candidatus Sumerlaeaceae bacterium]